MNALDHLQSIELPAFLDGLVHQERTALTSTCYTLRHTTEMHIESRTHSRSCAVLPQVVMSHEANMIGKCGCAFADRNTHWKAITFMMQLFQGD